MPTNGCGQAPHSSIIRTLSHLHRELDSFFFGIERDCRECKDPDCMGYIWILERESERLLERGATLVQINDGPTFIHSFPLKPDGSFDFAIRYPLCSQLCADSRRCSIHEDRPLICRFYPLGLETEAGGRIVWGIHLDCLHIRRMEERGTLVSFEARAVRLLERIAPELMAEIVSAYEAVHTISVFPDGPNNYRAIKEVRHHVKV